MAADVITRFKLETTQFDSKLRDTAKALHDIASTAQNAGKDFNGFSQKSIEAARALGTVASGATNTKDKLRDLVGSYNDAVKAYDKLSDEAKKGEFGQALAASLQKLQQDIKQTKQELYGLGEATKNAGSSLFGDNGLTGMLQVFGGNLLTKGFEMLASGLTDAWSKSIELARAGEGVRIAFDRLNQPGLLDKLKEATHGTVSEVELMKQAIKFENFKLPLEDLATYLAFAQQKAKDTGESVDYMVNSITTGLGRQSKQILDNLGISAAELTKRMSEGADMTKAVADIIREEMAKAGDYVETAADRAAQAAAKATDEMERFGRQAAPIAEEWGQTWNSISIAAMDFANVLLGPVAESIRSIQNILGKTLDDRRIQMFEAFEKIAKQQQSQSGYKGMGDLQKATAPGGYVEVTDTNTGKVIGGMHFDNLNDKNAIKDWQNTLFKTPKTKSSSSANINDSIMSQWLNAKAKTDYMVQQDLLPTGPNKNSGYDMMREYIEKNILGVKDWDYKKDITEKDLKKLLGKDDKDKEGKTVVGEMQKLTSGVQGIFGGLQQMGIEIPEELQGIMSGIQGVMTILTSINTILGVIEGLQAVGVLPFFANGGVAHAANGIVAGNTYSGDQIPAFLNAGETVLSAAQAGNLASQLSGGSRGRIEVFGRLDGNDILLSADRTLMMKGKGQLLYG